MALYTQVIVSYDVADTKKRNKLFGELKDLGLKPIQKSVFWGYLLPSERGIVHLLFEKYCCIETDKAFMTNVLIDKNIEDTFGYDDEDFKHPEGFMIL
jgi:CRISPR-associated protein Cas2